MTNKIFVSVYDKNKRFLSKTTPAKARMLLQKNKAVILEYKPFKIKINKKGDKMFIAHQNNIINLDKVQAIELKENKVMFFTDNVTTRTNWKFKDENEAKEVFDELKSLIASKSFL